MHRIIIAAAGMCVLAACSGTQTPATVAAGATPLLLPPAQVSQLAQTCQVAEPLLSVAASPAMPATVKNTAVYGDAYCRQLLSGTVPATTDANTPAWLRDVILGVQVAAQVAKVVLPMVM